MKRWWEKYDNLDLLKGIASGYWKAYLQLTDHAYTFPTGSERFWEAERQSVLLLREWVYLCQKINQVIR